jgi:hypothetical protein
MVLGTRRLRDARQAERAMTEHVRDVAAMTSQLQRHKPVARKDRAVQLECAECRARYFAVLDDDPPDWKPHCN